MAIEFFTFHIIHNQSQHQGATLKTHTFTGGKTITLRISALLNKSNNEKCLIVWTSFNYNSILISQHSKSSTPFLFPSFLAYMHFGKKIVVLRMVPPSLGTTCSSWSVLPHPSKLDLFLPLFRVSA